MRTVFAILFSAVLILGLKPGHGSEAFAKAERQCARCACGNKCCVSQSTPASAPQPATPANVLPLKQIQPSLISAALLYSLPAAFSAAGSFADFSSDRLSAVPLYEWNC